MRSMLPLLCALVASTQAVREVVQSTGITDARLRKRDAGAARRAGCGGRELFCLCGKEQTQRSAAAPPAPASSAPRWEGAYT